MPTRADNMIKNRWYSTLAKKTKEEVAETARNYQNSPDAVLPHLFVEGEMPSPSSGMPQPTLDGIRREGSLDWAQSYRLTPLQIPSALGSLGMISPMAPSASPFALMSPFPKMMSMFSPLGTDSVRDDIFSPLKRISCSLTENRAEFANLIGHQ
jgi:hypothetical protein